MVDSKRNKLLLPVVGIIFSNLFILAFVNQYEQLLTLFLVYIVQTIIMISWGFIQILKLKRIYKTKWEKHSRDIHISRPLKAIISAVYLLHSGIWMVFVSSLVLMMPKMLSVGTSLIEPKPFLPINWLSVGFLSAVLLISLLIGKKQFRNAMSFGRIMLTPFLLIMPLFFTFIFAIFGGVKILAIFVLFKMLADIVLEIVDVKY